MASRTVAEDDHAALGSRTGARDDWQIEVFYDGDCPLCRREIAWLRRLDRHHRIRFTDIAAADFTADDYGVSWEALMSQIHARLPDGRWLQGVEVFRRLYAAVGGGPIVWLSRLPLLSGLLDRGYRLFARNRLRWTGRCAAAATRCTVPAPPEAGSGASRASSPR